MLHWLENETHARALGQTYHEDVPEQTGAREAGTFCIDIDELRDAALLAFGRAAECSSGNPEIEYSGGHRRHASAPELALRSVGPRSWP
jgi:hypothetical protein